MIVLSVVCRSCGRRLEEEVDEQVPPAWLRCSCGAKYDLILDDEPDMAFDTEVLSVGDDGADA